MRSTFPLLLALVACGKDDDSNDDFTMYGDDDVTTDHPAADCAGPQSGTFTGDMSGTIDADLTVSGVLSFTVATSIGTINLVGQLDAGGQIDTAAGSMALVGTYNYAACTATGTWDDSTQDLNGNWQLSQD